MKILMLFPYAPLPPPLDLAGTKRNLPFLLELAKYNEVSVLSYGSLQDKSLFDNSYGSLFSEVRFVKKRSRIRNGLWRVWKLFMLRSDFGLIHSKKMQQAIDEMTKEKCYDVIHCCVPFFGFFNFPRNIPLTSDTHEVKYDLLHRTSKILKNPFKRAYTYLNFRFGKKEEISLCSKFDLLFTTTERDKAVFKKQLPNQEIQSIQNGAGYSFFEDLDIEEESYSMIFTGLYTHFPNSTGIVHFLDKIFPLIVEEFPEAHIFIVGKSPTKEMLARASKNVIITGFVDDVRPYVAKSQVFVIPLYAGGGIRGKALEAMAMKRAIVTTSIGVEGIKLVHYDSALIVDSDDDFADSIKKLFRNNSLRKKISNRAFDVAKREYNWENKGKELHGHLQSIKKTPR